MALWVDESPRTQFSELDFHPEVNSRLQKIIESGDFPHLLLYGQAGGGKRTRVNALLRSLYGPDANRVKIAQKEFKVKGRAKPVEITVRTSNYHVEINPSDVGSQDRYVVQEVIKDIAQTRVIPYVSKADKADSARPNPTFRLVVLNEVDRLSRAAQSALRRTMEKYMSSCRLIMLCQNPARVIAPIRSRCLPIRVPLPSSADVSRELRRVADLHGAEVTDQTLKSIVESSERNMRRALLALEATCCCHAPSPAADCKTPLLREWEHAMDTLVEQICRDQSPNSLSLVRKRLYELLENCVAPTTVLKQMLKSLLGKHVLTWPDHLKREFVAVVALYQHRLMTGNKVHLHLEACIAQVMALYKIAVMIGIDL